MSEIDRVNNLIAGLQRKQPKVYEAFRQLTQFVAGLSEDVRGVKFLIQSIDTGGPAGGLPIAPNVTVFTYRFSKTNVILEWEQPDTSIFSYELRLGATWETASRILQTSTLRAVFDPLPVGTTRYWIKGIDFDGNISEDALSLDVIVPPLGNITINSTVIDNFILFQWSEPTSTFNIDYYELKRGSTVIGTLRGTFTAIFEPVGGTFEYKIKAFDIAGNESPETTISVVVAEPPDFDLIARGVDDLTGDKVNTIVDGDRLICNVDLTETWADHFSNNSWDTIQDQIDAGYPIYIQPTPLVGTYEKIFDFGSTVDNIVISLTWNQNQISGSTAVTSEISYSTDDITYSSPVSSRTLFADTLRYVKVKFTFTGADDTALLEFYDLIVNLNVKIELDSGQVMADSTDVDGTQVLFNKAFKDVHSITLTVSSVDPIIAVYDFIDIPDPTEFFVFAFDSSFTRVDYSNLMES